MKARELITTARKSALAHLGDEEAMAVLQLTDMVKGFIALADELEAEAEKLLSTHSRAGGYALPPTVSERRTSKLEAAKRIREILEET